MKTLFDPLQGTVRDWSTSAPRLEFLLVRESELPLWSRATAAAFAAPFARIYWNEGGPIALELPGRTLRVPAETFAVIGPDTAYIPRRLTAVRHVYLHVEVLWPWQLAAGVWLLPSDSSRSHSALLDALRSQVQPDSSQGLLVSALTQSVLAALPADAWTRHPMDAGIARTVEILRADPAHAPANATLADKLGLGVDGFIRRFRRATGTTPQAFSLRLRVSEAARLLATSAASISDIAAATGFSDRYHLTKAFTRLRGISPALWRRQMGNPASGSTASSGTDRRKGSAARR